MKIALPSLVLLVLLPAARGGVYSDADKCPFRIKADGTAEPLPASPREANAFPHHYAYAGNLGDPRPRKENTDRAALLKRLQEPVASPTPDRLASRGADLIRARQLDEAVNLLLPLARRNPENFRVQANLAHLHALRGDWPSALGNHDDAVRLPMPADMPGTTPEQRAWLKRVEKDYYTRWLKLRAEEARRRVPPAQETVLQLFVGPEPADAIAIVQQLLLWCPEDNRLYWLLAELYAKHGQPRAALAVYRSLDSFDRNYGDRRLMKAHMAEVAKVVEAMPPEAEPVLDLASDPVPPEDTRVWYERLGLTLTKLIAAGMIFMLFATVLLYLQVRAIRRR